MPEHPSLFSNLPEVKGKKITFGAIRYPIWTENKAKLISRYLYYFVLVTKHGAYIDGFAGPQDVDKPDMWAAKLVLESEPRWLRDFFLCDKNLENTKRLRALRDEQPGRKPKEPRRSVNIYAGDFNKIVHEVLRSDKIGANVAAFCLLDQRTFECHWQTVEAVAAHKSDGRKIEIFYFLAIGWLDRSLAAQQDHAVLEAWWGRPDWISLRAMQNQERAAQFCKRFKEDLGYTHVYPWPIYEKKTGGRIMYYMIHASDHDEAPPLMARAYRKATGMLEPLTDVQLEFDLWQKSR